APAASVGVRALLRHLSEVIHGSPRWRSPSARPPLPAGPAHPCVKGGAGSAARPIASVTATDGIGHGIRGRGGGADAFLATPVDERALIARLQIEQ
ncbi:MAG TPA: hypothetical protein VJ144_08385, partial [Candidatus Polarisedimenticolia bacterium]|nr:hypothetical protein [Candidatus Polarisedimenticolia bacterium]